LVLKTGIFGLIIVTIMFKIRAGLVFLGRPILRVLMGLFFIFKTLIVFICGIFLETCKTICVEVLTGFFWLVLKTGRWVLDFPKIRIELVKTKKRKKKHRKVRVRLGIIGISLFLILVMSGGVWYFYENIYKSMPSVEEIFVPPPLTTKILDRNGQLLYKLYRNQNRSWVELGKIPQNLIEATIAIEDKEYYKHNGFSIRGMIRAFIYNLENNDGLPIGGSTITQQLVKNTLLSSEKTWKRKVKELLLAVALEYRLDKDEILELYFNEVPYGGETYGVQEASLKYFGKNVWEINQAEAAFLAGLSAAPSRYSPFGPNPENAWMRQGKVVREMFEAGFIDEKELEALRQTKIEIIESSTEIKAPHFVFYVKDLVSERYGVAPTEQGGMIIKTSLDLDLQTETEKIVKEEIARVRRMNISNGAVLILDTGSGDVLAMVGSADYFDQSIDGKVNVVLRERQPGSSIKPVNYSVALGMGFTPVSIIPDSPITYQIPGQSPYSPKNYDNTFRGNVTLRTALASSLNVPAVKVLSAYGVDKMIDRAESLGINTWQDRSRYGLALTLGGGEVKMIELSRAYATFANLGKKPLINPVLEIKNHGNQVIYEKKEILERVLDPGIAFLIDDILSDDMARAPVFGRGSKLSIPGKTVAVKTGTTNSLKDNWCIGYTDKVLVAVWVGNNDGDPMSQVASGISGATPIWRRVMETVLGRKEYEETGWRIPGSITEKEVCLSTGTLPCEGCGPVKKEYFLRGSEPTERCVVIKEGEKKD
jgi:penicillin-binding protein 1C